MTFEKVSILFWDGCTYRIRYSATSKYDSTVAVIAGTAVIALSLMQFDSNVIKGAGEARRTRIFFTLQPSQDRCRRQVIRLATSSLHLREY
jgi:hypothetical protein